MAYDDPRETDSITHAFRQVVDDVRELFREELLLARAELRQEATVYLHSAINMAAAALFGLFATGFILLGLAQGAARWWGIGTWAAYILMGIVLGCIAGIALLMSRARARKTSAVPQRTVQSLEETKEWLNHRMTSNTR